MKKLLLVVALMLTACSPDEPTKQQQEADLKFQQAQQHFENATNGYINDRDFPNAGEVGALNRFQEREMEAAADLFKQLLNMGSDGQKLASATALAEIRAYQAQIRTSGAMTASNHLIVTGNKLLATVAASTNSSTMAKALTSGKAQQVYDSLVQRGTELKQQLGVAKAKCTMLEDQVTGLQQRKAEQETQRRQLMQKAAAITAQLGALRGDERFAQASKAIQLRKQADERTAEIESLSSQIDIKQGELKDARDAQEKLASRLAGVQATETSLKQRLDSRNKKADDASTLATDYTKQLTEALDNLTAQYDQQVIGPIEQSIKELTESITILDKAPQTTKSDRLHTDFNRAAKRAKLAYIQHMLTTVLHDYEQLLTLITSQTDQAIAPAKLATFTEAAKLATERIETVGANRTEHLTKASELFLEAADRADNTDMRTACYQQLVGVSRMLVNTTDEPSWQDKLQQYQQKLNQSGGEEPPA